MPTCTHCHREWTKRQIYKTFFKKIDSGIQCPYCGEVQYFSISTQKKLVLLNAPVLLLLMLQMFQIRFFNPFLVVVLLVTVYGIAYPCLIKLAPNPNS